MNSLFSFVDSILKMTGDNSVENRKRRLMEKMRQNPQEEETLRQQMTALDKFSADLELAMEEFRALRKKPLDDPDVALPNSCSANGEMLRGLTEIALQRHNQTEKKYYTKNHVNADPKSHLEHLRRRMPQLQNEESEDGNMFRTIEECLQQGTELSDDQKAFLWDKTRNDCKYDYHVVGDIGALPDGTMITIEEFAAETTQYVVSPFSSNGAVGLYKNGMEGVTAYYNLDNPLPNAEMQILAQINYDIKSS